MERTFALIKGSHVENHIVADDSFIEFIKADYDEIIETTSMQLKPSPGDALLEDKTFSHLSVGEVPVIEDEIVDAEVVVAELDAPAEEE